MGVCAVADESMRTDRRRFLHGTCTGATFLAAHDLFADEPLPAILPSMKSGHRILSLELLSAASLTTMRDFYGRLLGLPIVEDKQDRLTVAAGETHLNFLPIGERDEQPFYHFAFNIPENQIEAAWSWQKERTPLLPIPARLRDRRYPNDVVNYAHWNAHSVFFFDPAGNVVEYIARHDLKNGMTGDFSSHDILYASEIAFVSDDVPALSAEIKKTIGVSQYRGGDEQFMALGDEHGLLLVMKRGRIISFDSPDKKAVSVFRTAATVRGIQAGKVRLADGQFEITCDAA